MVPEPVAGDALVPDTAHLAHARQVADAVLYEGYLLYPYRQTAQKNQVRFQFGVLMPPGYATVDPNERAATQTECVLDCGDDAEVRVLARFLRYTERTVQAISPDTGDLQDVGALYVAGTEYTTWTEAREQEHQVAVPVRDLLAGDQRRDFALPAGTSAERITDPAGRPAGQVTRRWAGLDGRISLHAERVGRPVPGPAAANPAGEPDRAVRPAHLPRGRTAARADCRPPADRGAGRDVPVHDRPARMGQRDGRSVPQYRHLAGAGRARRAAAT